jgi:hypothetical protein
VAGLETIARLVGAGVRRGPKPMAKLPDATVYRYLDRVLVEEALARSAHGHSLAALGRQAVTLASLAARNIHKGHGDAALARERGTGAAQLRFLDGVALSANALRPKGIAA